MIALRRRRISVARHVFDQGAALNGVSQGTGYGDDGQNSTNYPIIRLTHRATGHVSFARSHDATSFTIKPTAKVATRFDIPPMADLGITDLEIIANGVASAKVAVRINP